MPPTTSDELDRAHRADQPLSPLFAKLRYKPGMRICVRHAPDSFAALLAALPATFTQANALRGPLDLVQAFFLHAAALVKEAPAIRQALAPNGIAWICYPKARALDTDLNRDSVRETLDPLGLTTVAQVAIDDVWSALRCKAT